MRIFTLALLLVVAFPAVAAAQPSAPGTSPPAASRPETAAPAVVDPYDPWVAAGLSLAGTSLAVGAGLHALRTYDEDLLAISGVGLLLLPSAGHLYTGEALSTGLVIRAVGAGVTAAMLTQVDSCQSEDCSPKPVADAIAIGTAIVLVGATVDILTAPAAARRANRAHRARVTIAPQIAPGHAGLAIAGSF